ncbi:homogentisate 1,2-dioxygenase [Thecamonas trahens ATCC 50062]|uniref:homogentisate 1,2-dioxygenase n=1 Tax=Thecamonas trahens ATCC 50062 TaxID=461836 RepID=A0A0L0D9K7_THETB|nr:homogentisate 1,2-dioxygenase [Thecamonas trahens ATCC 50062]KNC48751.1 homogentisate 1,2-dioxygenase [Thecamonas trahens ATCC 50062]|eukprot:XP_013762802.1 homogentisate 1,2-dioxygenase [Thecamonas trahens ATCC 50062]
MAAAASSTEFEYLTGFNNHFATEALPGALPKGKNSPQNCPYGLYAEQLSGTAFTRPRATNRRTWLYRIRPSVCHSGPFLPYPHPTAALSESVPTPPSQLRWKPLPIPIVGEGVSEGEGIDFVRGLNKMASAGEPSMKAGVAFYIYTANEPMTRTALKNADGDFLIVPQSGELIVKTEMGSMHVPPGFICVVQRGIAFSVNFAEGTTAVRGYVCEVYDGHFEIPDLGPIGANGLANPRDFESPVAAYDADAEDPADNAFVVVHKFLGALYETQASHSPFNVVAWHGNYAPWRYNLDNFNVINSVSFDHPDPCIFTVVTVQTAEPGRAALDFVVFKERWSVATDTFRPPYFHTNCMTEFMGLITGRYDAKEEGFLPGGASLHSAGSAHGPDVDAFTKATTSDLTPDFISEGAIAFMFESCYLTHLSKFALDENLLDTSYTESAWGPFESNFDPTKP